MITRILFCFSLFHYTYASACSVEPITWERYQEVIKENAIKSSEVSVAVVSRLSKIWFGEKKGYYKVTFTAKESWSRSHSSKLTNIKPIGSVIMFDYVGDGHCFSLDVEKGAIYWLFTSSGEYVAHYDVVSVSPRDIDGFRSTND